MRSIEVWFCILRSAKGMQRCLSIELEKLLQPRLCRISSSKDCQIQLISSANIGATLKYGLSGRQYCFSQEMRWITSKMKNRVRKMVRVVFWR